MFYVGFLAHSSGSAKQLISSEMLGESIAIFLAIASKTPAHRMTPISDDHMDVKTFS